jgi:predicted metalloendopeptidase
MSEETKREAEIKRSKMVALIGCPEKWQDYSDLAMNTKDNAV